MKESERMALRRLEHHLDKSIRLLPLYEKDKQKYQENESFQTASRLLLQDKLYPSIWDENILLKAQRLFETVSPNEELFGADIERIKQHTDIVVQINDFFFAILNKGCSNLEVLNRLSKLTPIPAELEEQLQATGFLGRIRYQQISPSKKISAFIDYLANELRFEFGEIAGDIASVLSWVQEREELAGPNVLLVDTTEVAGAVVPVQILMKEGSGYVKCLVTAEDNFRSTFERARSALEDLGWLKSSSEIEYSFDITYANYKGNSIGLAAAVGMYSLARDLPIDPYTAFTGDINLVGQQKFKILAITGLKPKLEAAALGGCRRVFIPKDNLGEIDAEKYPQILIHGVDDIVDVIAELEMPVDVLPSDTLQNRKINLLKACCREMGWPLSSEKRIQNTAQFKIAPLELPELTVTIYDTGTHVLKSHDEPNYQELLNRLSELDPKIPIESRNESLSIKDKKTQSLIQQSLEQLSPSSRKDEQYCEYSYHFESGFEKLVVKQYSSGKLIIQGKAGELFHDIMGIVILHYNLANPTARKTVDEFIKTKSHQLTPSDKADEKAGPPTVQLPHIGTDESGKGDYYGPLVVAGIWIDSHLQSQLENLGVKDSKKISDKRCRELAEAIRNLCPKKFIVVEITPKKYNELYAGFQREGKTLNHLLAWGHARAMENLLTTNKCEYAIADQFGDEKFILSKLMERGKRIELVQLPKGEQYTAVAAASILARDRFLSRMEELSNKFEIDLPKGASSVVIEAAKQLIDKHGSKTLAEVAKLHHKTTKKILGET